MKSVPLRPEEFTQRVFHRQTYPHAVRKQPVLGRCSKVLWLTDTHSSNSKVISCAYTTDDAYSALSGCAQPRPCFLAMCSTSGRAQGPPANPRAQDQTARDRRISRLGY